MKLLTRVAALVVLVVGAMAQSESDSPAQLGTTVSKVATAAKKELLIGVIFFDYVASLDWVGPSQCLELLDSIGITPRFVTISNRVGRIQGDTKVPVHSLVHYNDAPVELDYLDRAFVEYIKRASERATYVLAVCTGASNLASTGLLDGKRATTNKIKFTKIATAFPAVNWVPRARWVVDGKLWTSSGVAAGLDMGHAFIEDQYGAQNASEFARHLEIVPNTDSTNDPFVSSITPA